jgi:hypothetical protein
VLPSCIESLMRACCAVTASVVTDHCVLMFHISGRRGVYIVPRLIDDATRGERGLNVSGGKKKLPMPLGESCCRCAGRTPSALDTKTERELEGCTTLMIAHRSTVQRADQILVLEGEPPSAANQEWNLRQDVGRVVINCIW